MSRLLTFTAAVLALGLTGALSMPPLYAHGSEDHAPAAEPAAGAQPEHDIVYRSILMTKGMDPEKGKALFINKACITCHAVNGVGGTDAPNIDAHSMAPEMDMFEFAARMWNHSYGMVAVQLEALDEQITLTGSELAHITAFAHSDAVQHTVSEADIPERIRMLMHHDHGTDAATGHEDEPDHDKAPHGHMAEPHGH